MGRSSLAIIIPAKNEAKTIGRVIKQAIKYGSVIVIDDASQDNTYEVSKTHGAKVIRNERNLFYDESLNRGFKFAKKKKLKFLITIDADGQHDLKMIPVFLKNLKKGFDLILGKRKKLPRISENIISQVYKKKFQVSDLYCGMKGYNSKWLNKFKVFDRFGSVGTDLASRILNEKNTKFLEIVVKIKERKDTPRIGNKFVANFRIFKSFFLNLLNN